MLTLLMKPLQEAAGASQPLQTVKDVGNDIYIVLTVTMMVWIGLFLYMLLMERRVKDVENKLDQLSK